MINKIVLNGKELIVPTLEDVLADSDNGVKNKVLYNFLKNNSDLTTDSKEVVGAINELKANSVGRFLTMPTPSASYANGAIYQYIGVTTVTEPIYKHGDFYECKESTTTPGTYAWEVVGGTSGNYVTIDTDQVITGTKIFTQSAVFKSNDNIFTTIYRDASIQLTDNSGDPNRTLTIFPDRISNKVGTTPYNIAFPTKDGTFALTTDVDNQIKTGTTAPTQTTYGKVGQLYIDSSTGKIYKLDSKVGTAYNWSEYTGPLFKDVTDFPDVGEENYIYRAKQSIVPGEDPQLVCKFYSENAWHPLAAAKIAGDEDITNIYTKEINFNKDSKITNKEATTTDCPTTLLAKTDDIGRYVVYGGTDWDKGAFFELYGKDIDPTIYSSENRQGSFLFGTGPNTSGGHWELGGTIDGDLVWRSKNSSSVLVDNYRFAYRITDKLTAQTRVSLFKKTPNEGDTMLCNCVLFTAAESPLGSTDSQYECEVHSTGTASDTYGYIIAKHRTGIFISNLDNGTWGDWYKFGLAADFLKLSGGTMTGTIKLASTGLQTYNSGGYKTDQYGNFIHLSTTNTQVWSICNNSGTSKFKVNYETGATTIAGDTSIGGALNMNSKKITSLATPTANTDAATKAYADSLVAQTVGTPTKGNSFAESNSVYVQVGKIVIVSLNMKSNSSVSKDAVILSGLPKSTTQTFRGGMVGNDNTVARFHQDSGGTEIIMDTSISASRWYNGTYVYVAA